MRESHESQEEQEHQDIELPFLDALERIRWRIFKCAAALFAGMVAAFVLVHNSTAVTAVLVRPIAPFLENQDGRLAAFSPLTPFLLELKLAFIGGIVLALPVILYQAWGHFSPVMKDHEKRLVLPSLYGGVVLFALGVGAAYLILPISLKWLFMFQEESLELFIEANAYLSFVVRLLVAFGLVFEIPVVVMILTSLGLVSPTFLRQKRRHAIVGITVLASLVTPGDLASTFLMMIPMIVLYELSIFLSVAIHRRNRERELEEAGTGAEAEAEVGV